MTSCACLILLVIALGTRAQGRQAAPGLTRGPYGSENATCYGRRYPDLAYLLCKDECNVQALHRHFQKHGRQEGRRFDCEAAPLTAAETARWKVHEARLRANHPVACGPGKRRFLVYQYGARPRPVPANAAARVAK